MRVSLPQSGHTSCTLLACNAPSRSTIPPLMLRCGLARVWRLIMFTPSTMRRLLVGMTFSTRPRLPLYFPVVTRTVSFFRMGVCSLDIFLFPAGLKTRRYVPRRFQPVVEAGLQTRLEHLRCKGDDLHESPLAQLA